MRTEDAIARAKAWNDAPQSRPEPGTAKEVSITLVRRIEELEAATRAVLREALDRVPVHPCDDEDDAVRAKGLYGPEAALYAVVQKTAE